ncbi:unnamed protein product [Symbiodinium necroappetens]|uniref:Uncharacterized protein n=1 Tax=Symbiodinium necroappetens TaxID=1628268 RepID=A0A812TWF6_9DINO|nr:unnamed protein product [Symbiodinium necroappetens]
MPLSEEQNKLLKTSDTAISFRSENPKKPGSKAWERFEKYKTATTIGEATNLGAQWQDISADFEKEFLTFADVDMPVISKRSAPEGSPDKEAKARSRHKPAQAHEGALSAPSNQDIANTQLEMSAATISILRTMMREELSEVEHRISSKFDASIANLHAELAAEKQARTKLEERIARLESNHDFHNKDAREDVDKSIVVIGGFGEKPMEEAEALSREVLQDERGLCDVTDTDTEPALALAR